MRYANIEIRDTDTVKTVEGYLPDNYKVASCIRYKGKTVVMIKGEDKAGWTLDGYVLPRLATGLMFGYEITKGGEAI